MKIYKDGRGRVVRFELKTVSAVFEFFGRSLRENEYNPTGWGLNYWTTKFRVSNFAAIIKYFNIHSYLFV